jgi:NADH dehydrogenase
MHKQRVVIVGGGFGGLNAAQALRRVPVDVTLVDRRNFHLFQPLLYQVATGGLSPSNIAVPLRSIVRKQKNCRVLMAEVVDFDLQRRVLKLANDELPYDSLIVAAGAQTGYFGRTDWAGVAPGLKSIEDALEIRRRVLTTFESAEQELDPSRRAAMLTFVVIGGGPTGVELAGTLAEITRHTLRQEFRRCKPEDARIILVDVSDRVLNAFPSDLSESARKHLQAIQVEVRTGTRVVNLDERRVELQTQDMREVIEAKTVLWAAGVDASPLGTRLIHAAKCEAGRGGRVPVGPELHIAGFPEVFVIGDLAAAVGVDGKPLPGVAPVAIQQGKYVAGVIQARLNNQPIVPFRYHDYGNMATIGRSAAVAQLGSWKFRGRIAWLLWLFIHLIQIVRFENRLLVLIQWAWNYLTFNRSARLITDVGRGKPPGPDQSNRT